MEPSRENARTGLIEPALCKVAGKQKKIKFLPELPEVKTAAARTHLTFGILRKFKELVSSR
jgi:hypothetical protein